MGKVGSGKTTLLRSILGEVQMVSGKVKVNISFSFLVVAKIEYSIIPVLLVSNFVFRFPEVLRMLVKKLG